MAFDEPAEEHEERGIDDGVAVEDRRHVVERWVAEVVAYVRQRDVDDEQVEIGHDEAGDDVASTWPGVVRALCMRIVVGDARRR